MNITVVCPQCKARYQVDPAMRGKKMRCPNGTCRTVFDVSDAGMPARVDPPPAGAKPPPPKSGSGSVNDMVPMLPAEAAAPPPPRPAPPARSGNIADYVPIERAEIAPPASTGPAAGDWRSLPNRGAPSPPAAKQQPPPAAKPASVPPPSAPPPPNRPVTVAWREEPPALVAPGQSRPAPASPAAYVPVEMPVGYYEAPPVRQEGVEPAAATPATELDEDIVREAKRRAAKRRMIGIVGVAALLVLAGLGVIWYFANQTEEKQFADAMKQYEDRRYGEAAKKLRKLVGKFSDSSRKPEYLLLASLADLLGSESLDNEALDRLNAFLDEHSQSPVGKSVLAARAEDLGTNLLDKADRWLKEKQADADAALRDTLQRIETTVNRVSKMLPDSIPDKDAQRIANLVADHQKKIQLAADRAKAIKDLAAKGKDRFGAAVVKEARDFLTRTARVIPGIDKDPEALKILGQMEEAHRDKVRHVTDAKAVALIGPRFEDTDPGILLDTQTIGAKKARGKDGAVVLALVRGVLYVLDAVNGEIRWARRVGIDTSQLPIRLPPDLANSRERLLVLAADTRTLTALDLDNRKLWEYRLGSPVLGRPVIVNQRAYLATYDGQVHEVELSQGKLLGRYELGQTLSAGGVHQKGTNLIYFPAEDTCVYVLDVVKKKCEMILYSNHPAGALRGEPVILGDEEFPVPTGANRPPPYLFLTQADGLDETLLKLYKLPITERHAGPVEVKPEPKVRGWTWFRPYADTEKIVCISDSARLGLFGIRQVNNDDAPLFPLVPVEGSEQAGVDLTDLLNPGGDLRRGRSLVAHVQGDDLWVLAYGKLQRLELRLAQRLGRQLPPRWKTALELGSPLHAEQVREEPNGSTLYLVTQGLTRPVCLVTAIDPEAGDANAGGDPRVRWQRQLGMVCHGEPVLLGDEVLAMDRAGGFFRFPLRDFKEKSGWMIGGERVAGGSETGASEAPQLIRADARTVYAVSTSGGTRLLVRRYEAPAPGGKTAEVAQQEVELEGRLAGTVAILGNSLLVPLSNGRLVQYELPLKPRAVATLVTTWRSRLATPDVRCEVVVLDANAFLTTDGHKGVTHWKWPQGAPNPDRVPNPLGGDRPTTELPERLAGALVVLPRANPMAELQVLVADHRGVVMLLRKDGLAPDRKWTLPGRITAGPFSRGDRVGFVVDHTRLAWLDPSKEAPPWVYQTVGDPKLKQEPPRIVGEPRRIDDLILVCDESGRFMGLDPKTGKPLGDGYTLKAAVAPAAPPVAFGPGRAFAPLTDGTIMLLSLDRLKNTPPKEGGGK